MAVLSHPCGIGKLGLILLFISFLCPSQALADECVELLDKEGIRYTRSEEPVVVFMSWQGGDFQKCSDVYDSKWSCGDKKFYGTLNEGTQAIDKNGNEWFLSSRGGNGGLERAKKITEDSCKRISRKKFLQTIEVTYHGLIDATNIEVTFKLIDKIVFNVTSPSF